MGEKRPDFNQKAGILRGMVTLYEMTSLYRFILVGSRSKLSNFTYIHF